MAKSNIINIMLRPKGYPNKITPEVKDKLQLIIDDLILALDSNEYTALINISCRDGQSKISM